MNDAKPRGRFVWFDLHTTEPTLAPGFYTRVTGWGTMPWQGAEGYTMWTSEGAPLGGVGKLGKLDKNGAQGPHWLGYV
jgi:predicted enzyme related to lactoylglutathione lyase